MKCSTHGSKLNPKRFSTFFGSLDESPCVLVHVLKSVHARHGFFGVFLVGFVFSEPGATTDADMIVCMVSLLKYVIAKNKVE